MRVLVLREEKDVSSNLLAFLEDKPEVSRVLIVSTAEAADAFNWYESESEPTVVLLQVDEETSSDMIETNETRAKEKGFVFFCLVSSEAELRDQYARDAHTNTSRKAIRWDEADLQGSRERLNSHLHELQTTSNQENSYQKMAGIVFHSPVMVALITTVVGGIGVAWITDMYSKAAATQQMQFQAVKTLMELTTNASTEDLVDVRKLSAVLSLVQSNEQFSSIDTESYDEFLDDLTDQVEEKIDEELKRAKESDSSDEIIAEQIKELEKEKASLRRVTSSREKLEGELAAMTRKLSDAVSSRGRLDARVKALESEKTQLLTKLEKSYLVVAEKELWFSKNQTANIGDFVIRFENVGDIDGKIEIRSNLKGLEPEFGQDNIGKESMGGRFFDDQLVLVTPVSIEQDPERALLSLKVLHAPEW